MQLGFHFDQSRCTGCFACAVACKDWHDIPAGPAKWMRILYHEEGKYPDVFVSHVASPCYHCTQPVCAWICPNEAITKREEDGVVVVDRDKCRNEKTCGIIKPESVGQDYLYGESQAPCQVTCPAHLYIPGYIALIAKGKFNEALDLIRRRMPLPSVCGRVCLNPCETECKRKDLDEPVAIEALKRFVTDNVKEELPQRLPQTYKEKVAIVGSGPAGLAAAYDLIRMGYGVTVFEALPVAGGMLSVGIPEHRLPKATFKHDIDYIKALGVEIKTNSPVSLDGGLEGLLKEEYGAVLLSMGAHKGQKLNIPGADSNGVLVGTSFMHDVNTGKKVAVGKKVMVIGGGNVAMDCARSARRLGATEVHVACLESRDVMPAEAGEIEQAEEEGIKVHPSLTPTQIVASNGKISGVDFQKITNLKFDKDGRPQFDAVSGSKETFPAETVIFAIGQVPEVGTLSEKCDIKLSQRGCLNIDPETMMSGMKGVFAAGDCVNGATNIVDAIASGQKAAFYINRYLQGDVLRVRAKKSIKASDIQVEIPSTTVKEKRQAMPLLAAKDRVSTFKEVALGLTPEAAIAEAKRCLNCAGHLCKDACPYEAPQFADEEKAKMQKCDLCFDRFGNGKKPICVEACPVRALDAGKIEDLRSKYGDLKEAYGFRYSAVTEPAITNKPKKPKR